MTESLKQMTTIQGVASGKQLKPKVAIERRDFDNLTGQTQIK